MFFVLKPMSNKTIVLTIMCADFMRKDWAAGTVTVKENPKINKDGNRYFEYARASNEGSSTIRHGELMHISSRQIL